MIEVHPNLFVGNQLDYENIVKDHDTNEPKDGWAVVHACKEPYHRQALGYSGRAVGKEHPEYLVAMRGREIMLNMVDVPDPRFIAEEMVDPAIEFIALHLGLGRKVLTHCNQGGSRGPTLAMLYMAKHLPEDFEQAEEAFRMIYPSFAPAGGCRGYAEKHWMKYRAW